MSPCPACACLPGGCLQLTSLSYSECWCLFRRHSWFCLFFSDLKMKHMKQEVWLSCPWLPPSPGEVDCFGYGTPFGFHGHSGAWLKISANCRNVVTGLHASPSHTLLPPLFDLAVEQMLKKWNAGPCLHPWKPGSAPGPGPEESRWAGGANSTSSCGFERYRAN